MIKGGRIVFDQGDLDDASAAIRDANPKVSPGTAERLSRIVFESIGMEPHEALTKGATNADPA